MSLPSVALHRRSYPCYLVPDLESPLTFGSVFPSLEQMPSRTEMLMDWTEG